MFANVWIAIREEAQAAIIERLRWDDELEYTGPVTDREHRLFRYMADQDTVQKLFKTSTAGGKVWTLWSVNFTESLPKVKIELDQLLADRPNHVAILGAWRHNGSQHGMEPVYSTRTVDGIEETYVSGYGGTATYPVNQTQLLKFMPDVWNGDEPPTYTAATQITDVNIMAGQALRDFS